MARATGPCHPAAGRTERRDGHLGNVLNPTVRTGFLMADEVMLRFLGVPKTTPRQEAQCCKLSHQFSLIDASSQRISRRFDRRIVPVV